MINCRVFCGNINWGLCYFLCIKLMLLLLLLLVLLLDMIMFCFLLLIFVVWGMVCWRFCLIVIMVCCNNWSFVKCFFEMLLLLIIVVSRFVDVSLIRVNMVIVISILISVNLCCMLIFCCWFSNESGYWCNWIVVVFVFIYWNGYWL